MVFRLSCKLLLPIVFLTACRDKLKTNEMVEQAVVERLQAHSGLDLKALDITTTNVVFEKNTASATVAIHPKDDASVNSGMTMKYTLEERNGKWVVTGVNNASGGSLNVHPPSGLGPATAPGAETQPLPAGHPSISEPQKQ